MGKKSCIMETGIQENSTRLPWCKSGLEKLDQVLEYLFHWRGGCFPWQGGAYAINFCKMCLFKTFERFVVFQVAKIAFQMWLNAASPFWACRETANPATAHSFARQQQNDINKAVVSFASATPSTLTVESRNRIVFRLDVLMITCKDWSHAVCRLRLKMSQFEVIQAHQNFHYEKETDSDGDNTTVIVE